MKKKFTLKDISTITGKHTTTLLKYLNKGGYDKYKLYEPKPRSNNKKKVWVLYGELDDILKTTKIISDTNNERRSNKKNILKNSAYYIVLSDLIQTCTRLKINYNISFNIDTKEEEFYFDDKPFKVDVKKGRIVGFNGENLVHQYNERIRLKNKP